MVGDPTVSAASLTLTSIMKIFGQYQAYRSSKIRETDKGLREEIGRRLEMIQNHINTLENRFLASKNASAIEVLNRARLTAESFRQDASFGPTGTTDATSAAPALKKGQIKAMMDHDLEVLKRLVEATHMVNALVDESSTEEGVEKASLMEFEQKLVGVQNRFADRVSYLAKL